jgi:hypothetical protein
MKKSAKRILVKKIFKIVPYFLVLVLGIAIASWWLKDKRLYKNPGFTNGKAVFFAPDYKGIGGGINYTFKIGDKEYKNTGLYPNVYASKGDNLVGKSFPVVYDKDDENNNMMLITPKNFERFNIPFPDSLEWVLKYLQQ